MTRGDSKDKRQEPHRASRGSVPAEAQERLEMMVMARVEQTVKGFEREREDKESRGHEHGKNDRREDRGEDKGDE
jgi:hypothetical protein